jgi:hypothetical protein
MKRKRHKRYAFCLVALAFLAGAFFSKGCRFIGLLGTPTRSERKIAAEYELTKHKGQKMLVLVNQPAWLNAQANLRYYLTKEMNESLTRRVKIRRKHLITYDELWEFRSGQRDLLSLSPIEVGAALKADVVLSVTIENYELNEMPEKGYYKGFLGARVVLNDVDTGNRLWPENTMSKSIKVGFEVGSGGREAAVKRLARACAYCTTRYFYNCPEDKFKIGDDRSDISWESWKR